ncbi:MAG TPA: SpoIID/LytB domain-containing protein [Dissulfurispiraceae bacterium]|nr:SpoIID/LytB domain-containing protein [Dissulfurispiraceae bacterium]
MATSEKLCMTRRNVRGRCPIVRTLPILLVVLYFGCCLTNAAYAEISVRVLLTDNKDLKMPSKDERLTRMGSASGDVHLVGTKYSGVIEVWKGDKGLYIINDLPLEDYVKGVVASEMKSSWDIEALKAQAVAARTYAIYQMGNSAPGAPYNLTSTVLDQAYKGSNGSAGVEQAVNATRGEILTYDGRPILAFYHSTSGGMTEDAAEVFGRELPYLKPVKTGSELSPYFMWEKIIPVSEIEKALDLQGIKEISIESRTASGRAKEISILLESGNANLPATEMRKKMGWDRLPSTLITRISRNNSLMVFEGRGYGHGVGMCQWSALEMARDGMTYRQILEYFYPGTKIQKSEDR